MSDAGVPSSPLLAPLTREQRSLVESTLGPFQTNGRWPTFSYVEAILERESPPLVASEVVASLPAERLSGGFYRAIWTSEGSGALAFSPQATVGITLLGMYLAGTGMDVDGFIAIIQLLARWRLAHQLDPYDPTPPTVSWSELRQDPGIARWLRFTSNEAIVREVLEHEPPTWGLVSDSSDGGWQIRLDRRLGGFDEVRTIEDYVPLLPRHLSPYPPSSQLDGLSVDLERQDLNAQETDDARERRPVRVFLSHLAVHKKFVSDVSTALARWNVQGFVAHVDIVVSKEWQTEIERALNSAEALVGLVHQNFSTSGWAQQEVGWAYGRQIPVLMVRLGEVPGGFPARFQWESMVDREPAEVAQHIVTWLMALDQFEKRVAPAADARPHDGTPA